MIQTCVWIPKSALIDRKDNPAYVHNTLTTWVKINQLSINTKLSVVFNKLSRIVVRLPNKYKEKISIFLFYISISISWQKYNRLYMHAIALYYVPKHFPLLWKGDQLHSHPAWEKAGGIAITPGPKIRSRKANLWQTIIWA